MNLEKAIEIKERKGEEFLNTDPDEIDEADRLSIEALNRIFHGRLLHNHHCMRKLPGETKD